MAHDHVDLAAAARAMLRTKVRRLRRGARRVTITSRHHGSERAAAGR